MKKFLLAITTFCLFVALSITMTACGNPTPPSALDTYFVFDNVTYDYLEFTDVKSQPTRHAIAMLDGNCWKYISSPETENESTMWFDGSKYYDNGDELSWSVARVNGSLDSLIDAFNCFKLGLTDDDTDGIWTSSDYFTTKTPYSKIIYSNITVTIKNEKLVSVTYTHTNEFSSYSESILVSYEFYNWGTTVI